CRNAENILYQFADQLRQAPGRDTTQPATVAPLGGSKAPAQVGLKGSCFGEALVRSTACGRVTAPTAHNRAGDISSLRLSWERPQVVSGLKFHHQTSCSNETGRTSAPRLPQALHTNRGSSLTPR